MYSPMPLFVVPGAAQLLWTLTVIAYLAASLRVWAIEGQREGGCPTCETRSDLRQNHYRTCVLSCWEVVRSTTQSLSAPTCCCKSVGRWRRLYAGCSLNRTLRDTYARMAASLRAVLTP